MHKCVELFIGGAWKPASNGRVIPIINPANEEQIGVVAEASQEDLDLALVAADKGFRRWRAVSAYSRSQCMRRAAENVRQRAEKIAGLITLEQGKPLAEARLEVLAAADIIEWFAEEGRRTYGRIIPARAAGVSQYVVREPIGPVAAFAPWNFPINQVVRKLSAAVATGCSIIIKGPEEAPSAPAELIQAFVDTDIPEGVVNLVYGVPDEISRYLIAHPIIRKVSFTGSTPIGKKIAELAGRYMKRATMELGGHAPVLIFEDADIERAAQILVSSKFRNAGQTCICPTRFLVQDSAYDKFISEFSRHARQIKVGAGVETTTTMGPLAHQRRLTAIEALVDDAKACGGDVVLGGARIGATGYFYSPTVLANVPTSARVMNEEPFGPLAIINKFVSVDQAIDEANRLRYGLAAYAYTRSPTLAKTVSERVEAGMLSINHFGLTLPETPFGGLKDSGYGSEGGVEGLDGYLNTKFISELNS